jgi:hypothetical protein
MLMLTLDAQARDIVRMFTVVKDPVEPRRNSHSFGNLDGSIFAAFREYLGTRLRQTSMFLSLCQMRVSD